MVAVRKQSVPEALQMDCERKKEGWLWVLFFVFFLVGSKISNMQSVFIILLGRRLANCSLYQTLSAGRLTFWNLWSGAHKGSLAEMTAAPAAEWRGRNWDAIKAWHEESLIFSPCASTGFQRSFIRRRRCRTESVQNWRCVCCKVEASPNP